jgi:hypothetical protein
MVSANGNTPIIFLSDVAEPRCIRNGLKWGRRLPLMIPLELLPVPADAVWRDDFPRTKPAFGTGQVAEYGRLRWASIQPQK